MARRPSEMSARLLAEAKETADHYEEAIDEYIDGLGTVDSDGSFRYPCVDPSRMTPLAIAEIARRYEGEAHDGWVVHYFESNPEELEFVPRIPGRK